MVQLIHVMNIAHPASVTALYKHAAIKLNSDFVF